MIDPQKWAIVAWANPKYSQDSKQRFMETITGSDNAHPVAFPLEYIRKTLPNAIFSETSDIFDYFGQSTQEFPLVVTVDLARRHLGLEDFSYSNTTKEE